MRRRRLTTLVDLTQAIMQLGESMAQEMSQEVALQGPAKLSAAQLNYISKYISKRVAQQLKAQCPNKTQAVLGTKPTSKPTPKEADDLAAALPHSVTTFDKVPKSDGPVALGKNGWQCATQITVAGKKGLARVCVSPSTS